MRKLFSTLFILIVASTLFSFRLKDKKELQKVLDKIVIDLDVVLSDEWYVVPNETGFDLNYCPTCMEKFKAYRDSTKDISCLNRTEIFEKFGPDSVYFHSMVGIVRTTPEQNFIQTKNNGILKFQVRFEEKWDSTEINRVQVKNDTLKNAIYTGPVYKTSEDQFNDYRRFVPPNYWKERTAYLGYSEFERLPYSSLFYDYSIFIDFGDRCYFCLADYIVSKDSTTKKVVLDEINNFQTQLLLAYVLGIPDFNKNERPRQRTVYSSFKPDIELR